MLSIGHYALMRGRRRFVWGLLAVVSIVSWVGVALVGLAGLTLIGLEGDLGCDLSGADSNYGTLSWSALPPGPVCTYTVDENGVGKVDGPSPVTSIWLLTLVGLGVGATWTVRRAFEAHEVIPGDDMAETPYSRT